MTPLIFGLPGGSEIIILLVVAILVFGGSRLAGIGKGTGRAIREFKEETQALRKDGTPEPKTAAGAEDEVKAHSDPEVVEAEVVDPATEPRRDV